MLDEPKQVRRPWGMPSWAFWVIALVVGGAIGNIPYAGMPIMVVLLIAAFVYWARLPTVTHPNFIPVTSYEPLELDGEQEVVGESHYRDQIAAFVGAHGRNVMATLTHEPKNKHSPSRSAVRVNLIAGEQTVTCGYIPENIAPFFAGSVAAARARGVRYVCDARVHGGRVNAPDYGVWLSSPSGQEQSGPRFEPSEAEVEPESTRDFWSQQQPGE